MAERPTRRQLMFGAAGALIGAAGAAGGVAATLPGSTPEGASGAQRVPDAGTGPVPRVEAVSSTEWISSEARGRSVRLVTVLPRGVEGPDRAALPVCIGLHGLRGNAAWFGERGTRRILGQSWSAGAGPFALVALDGGDNYWHPYTAADDPLAMLLTELPAWLRERGLGGVTGLPTLAMGVSMGGTGALVYARERIRRGRPLLATAALSPGLFLDWSRASRRPFRSEANWAAYDPIRFWPELAPTPMGVWCGDRDMFIDATRHFIRTSRPAVGRITPGRHDGAYYAGVLPEVYRFLGSHLPPPRPASAGPAVNAPVRPVG